ncbi:MAG: hypothetical protein ACUVQ0_04550 [Thermoproteota archaeon]
MRKILLISHCILNPYSKAQGTLTREKVEASRRALESLLSDYETGIVQLSCPEMVYKGLLRKPASREAYDNPEFRKVCKDIACKILQNVKDYEKKGVSVPAYIGIEGSPSCGVNWTHLNNKVVRGCGVFTELLVKTFEDAGIRIITLGLPEKEEYGRLEDLLKTIRNLK